ncbi:concanavalin A-like lectin/glucanase [Polyplosphaeria fusca]|uniref:Concanavalin A-like lectin/glucanase n=1 Tax=Polyplosphaeria fusca TaxID=682080 RepID=A0A9P4UZ67_9PLEO|nr:concanavalin A-like lectin/glucanase [Polyplosphaeria fusca]
MGFEFPFKFPSSAPGDKTGRTTRQSERNSQNSIQTGGVSTPKSYPSGVPLRKPRHEFKSYRLRGEYYQPWLGDKRLTRTKWGNIVVYVFIALSLCVCGYLAYDGAKDAKIGVGEYCLVLEDHFNSIDPATWTHEVQIGGFGTGSFDWTTPDSSNSFTDKDGLHIVPTLTTESTPITEDQILNGYSLNLTKSGGDGSCTSTDIKQCSIRSNATTGLVVPPVRSARLSTKGKKSIKYGRVEVVAKMPKGDWLWPAIWMMPEESKYGAWPASGEIDIAELRGNSWKYPLGNDAMSSALHWGPTPKLDAYWKTYGLKFLRRGADYTKDYHTYGLIWTEDYLFTYLDSTLKQVFYMKFGKAKSMWERGGFEGVSVNNTVSENPWKSTGRTNTPFDENFYLILNVAVGSQNGWFYDGKYNKPWVDNGPTAPADFYKGRKDWLPTWGEGNDRGMTVKSVKMWREGGC